eukprot:514339_1
MTSKLMNTIISCYVLTTIIVIFGYLNQSCQAYLPSTEISALADLYSSLNGKYWTECQWNITELQINKTLPTFPNTYCGLVMRGSIRNNINIHYIEAIVFTSENNLNGSISNSIGNLTNLLGLYIWNNQLLTGTIPDTLCNLSQLIAIGFGLTNLYGEFPSCIGTVSSLMGIRLNSSGVSLSFSANIIESLCVNANKIRALYFWEINYYGHIPECIGYAFPQLQFLVFYNLPNLTSTIPQSFNNLTNLGNLVLSFLPNLYGTFPSNIIKTNQLYMLDIDYTSLSGSINLQYLCENINMNMQFLSIDHNHNLSFTIPNCINKLPNLKQLILDDSPLIHGTIPDTICELHDLIAFKIYETSITGILPECISNLTNLIYIVLHSNNLNGEFPTMSSTKLKLIDIHNNSFTG